MTLGLGTGSTAYWFIVAVGELVAGGMRLSGVPTSAASEALAARFGIPMTELDSSGVDLAVDGADAVDPRLRLIKGRGGALVREKVVAASARRFVVVVDESKLCDRLRGPIPVEVLPFGAGATLAAVGQVLGAEPELRRGSAGVSVLSDNGNLLADARVDRLDDPEGTAERLQAIPGLVGHGLFLGMADLVVSAGGDGLTTELTPSRPRSA